MSILWKANESTEYTTFSMWDVVTDFFIPKDLVEDMRDIAGIEMVEWVTRYRIRLAISQAFELKDVVDAVENVLTGPSINPVVDERIRVAIAYNQLAEPTRPFWSIYALPNGNIDTVSTDDEEEFSRILQLHGDCYRTVGGLLISSNDM